MSICRSPKETIALISLLLYVAKLLRLSATVWCTDKLSHIFIAFFKFDGEFSYLSQIQTFCFSAETLKCNLQYLFFFQSFDNRIPIILNNEHAHQGITGLLNKYVQRSMFTNTIKSRIFNNAITFCFFRPKYFIKSAK